MSVVPTVWRFTGESSALSGTVHIVHETQIIGWVTQQQSVRALCGMVFHPHHASKFKLPGDALCPDCATIYSNMNTEERNVSSSNPDHDRDKRL